MAVKRDNCWWRDALPEGWHCLYDRLVVDLAREDPAAVVEDAKQKFGTMRIYLERYTDRTRALVDEASRLSARTCERCGGPGALTVTRDGYYETLCEAHRGAAELATANPIVASFWANGDGAIKKVDRT